MAKRLQTVATACMTVQLMLFNLIFCCSGLVLLCVGLHLKILLDNYADVGIENSGGALLATLCLGALIALVAMLACCCTVRQHPALLYVYGAFLAVIALLQLSAGASAYTYRTALVDGFDRGLNESLATYGEDKIKTVHMDMTQRMLHCCGNRAYSDYMNVSPSKHVPSSCCAVMEGECDTTDLEDIYTEGCYNRVMNFIKTNTGLVVGVAFGLAAFPILGLVHACCLASYINKVNYEQIA